MDTSWRLFRLMNSEIRITYLRCICCTNLPKLAMLDGRFPLCSSFFPPAQPLLAVDGRVIHHGPVNPLGHPPLCIVKQVLRVAVHVLIVDGLPRRDGHVVDRLAGHQPDACRGLLMCPVKRQLGKTKLVAGTSEVKAALWQASRTSACLPHLCMM